MAQGLGHRRDFCNICGAEMSSYGIEDHQRHVHPDIFERRQREFSHALGRAALVFVPAGAAFFLALFVPDVIFGIREPSWYVGVIFLGFMVSMFAPLPYAARKRRAYLEAGGDILLQCPVCDAKIVSLRIRSHLASDHPGESRRLKVLVPLVYGSLIVPLVGVLALLWGVIVGIFPLEWGEMFPTMMIVIFAAWGAVFIPWGVFVERPHRAKVRAEWQSVHVGTQRSQR